MSIQFIDLKAQYQHLKADIDARIHAVLDHGQYIMGPEVKELESALAAFTGSRHCITVATCEADGRCAIFTWRIDVSIASSIPTAASAA